MKRSFRLLAGLTLSGALLACGSLVSAQNAARLLRQPTISQTSIVFVYGGDLWSVPRAGGQARRLTANPSVKRFPHFSPDGKQIAFSGNYDGNTDVYTIPAEGGEPKRLTYHPFPDNVLGWTPDGKSVLFRSIRSSFSPRFQKLFTVPTKGGLEKELPLPEGGLASFSPDGTKLAYNRIERENATWKRYRGGEQSYVSIYDIANNVYSEVPHQAETDFYPMWHGTKIYFASDRTETVNLFSYDIKTKAIKQLTHYSDYDVKWPSLGPDAIVYEHGGELHVLDVNTEKDSTVPVEVYADLATIRPELRRVESNIVNFGISPSGVRGVFEARGDLFTVPAKKGETRDISNSPGVREISPAWSPDGKYIAYFSDRNGEYDLYIRPQDGTGTETRLTTDANVYRTNLNWSPDSKAIVYTDAALRLWYVTLADKKPLLIDSSNVGNVSIAHFSPDSKWLAYTKANPNFLSSIYLYSLDQKKAFPVTSGRFDDKEPVFDLNGKYLYFASDRTFAPTQVGPDAPNINFQNTTGLYAFVLQADTPSPFAPESDEEKVAKEIDHPAPPATNPTPGSPKPDPKKPDPAKPDPSKKADAAKAGGDEEKPATPPAAKPAAPATPAFKIDFEGLATRVIPLPVAPGNYGGLVGGTNKLFYAADGGVLHQYDLTGKSDAVILAGVNGYDINPAGTKIMYRAMGPGGPLYGIIDAAPGQQPGAGKLNVALEMRSDPRAEWAEMFKDAWRFERDYYYDPNMKALDWKAIGDRYGSLVKYASNRDDLTYLLGELIGELNTSHSYVVGAEPPQVRQIPVGLLGVDFEEANGRFRFKKIYQGENWDSDRRAPLTEPGVKVKQGDYLIAVNGIPLTSDMNPYSLFEDTVGKTVTLTVNSAPTAAGAHDTQVRPVASELSLRYFDWTESNRRKVEAATGGRVAYFHVPDTGGEGITEFGKGFYSQIDKEAVIVDERFNSGGYIPDFFVEKLTRRLLSIGSPRYGKDFPNPTGAIYGPKVIMANEWSGSGGDAFPYFFRKAGAGPIIGKRTWGGLVGINGFRTLMDGGGVTVPEFGIWSPQDGKWIAENHGIDPDIEVNNTPDKMRNGDDPQLDRAIAYIQEQLKKNPPAKYQHPPFPVERLNTTTAHK